MNEYEKSLSDLVKDLQAKGQSRVEKMQEQSTLRQQHFSDQTLSVYMLQKELAAYKDIAAKMENINNELKNSLSEQKKALDEEKKARNKQFLTTTIVSIVGIIAAALIGVYF